MAILSPLDIRKILRNNRNNMPSDDFRLIDSWCEYKDNKQDNERDLDYMCYEMEVINPETGEKKHLYKALKMFRIIRLPRDAKESTAFMDMQEQILSAVYEQKINLVTVIANIIEPVSLGLLFLYGVQGIAEDLLDAKKKADYDYASLKGVLQGTFRVLHFRCVVAQETEWLREKMYSMEYLTMVRGIPKASKSGENGGNKGIGNTNVNPNSQGTIEEMIAGMVDYEYVIQVLSSPVYMSTLKAWQTKTQLDMTMWNGQLQGTKSISANLSMPMTYMANASQSQGWSHAYTNADSVSYSRGESFTTGFGESVGQSLSQTFGQSFGRTQGVSVSNSVSQSSSVSIGNSIGKTMGVSQNISQNFGTSHNVGTNQGISRSTSESLGTSHSQGLSISQGQSVGQSLSQTIGRTSGYSRGITESYSLGETRGVSQGNSTGISIGDSTNHSNNHSRGTSDGTSKTWANTTNTTIGDTHNEGESGGETHGKGESHGYNDSETNTASHTDSGGHTDNTGTNKNSNTGWSLPIINPSSGKSEIDTDSDTTGWANNTAEGNSDGFSDTWSKNDGANEGWNSSDAHSESTSEGHSDGGGTTHTTSSSDGYSDGYGHSESVNSSQSLSESFSSSFNQSIGNNQSVSQSDSVSQGSSMSLTDSLTNGYSENYGTSHSMGVTNGASFGSSVSDGVTQSVGSSTGQSASTSMTQNVSQSQGVSYGTSVGKTQSVSATESTSVGTSQSATKSTSVSQGTSVSKGTSSSKGTSIGSSGTISTGTSGSMGLGPSIGFNKSYQWLDQQVKDILELLEYQNERIKYALRGAGAFYTYVYIACSTLDALSAAQALAKSTWQNEFAMIQPVQVLDLSEEEQKHLLYHFSAFSADVTKENVAGVSQYKYSTVLLPKEFVSYTHLPRISEGGVFAEVNDVPKFAVPSMLKGEIYMGSILSAERYSFENGYKTNFDYRISEKELMHGFFTGASRSGKTVAAMRFVAELSRIRRSKTGKRLRIVCMDPKQDWRALARFVEPERFRFYSMGNQAFHPLHFNPCKIPKGVVPQTWIDVMIEVYCRAYGLLERGKQLMAETFYSLYEEAGVFDAYGKPGWQTEVPELSKRVTFGAAYRRMNRLKKEMEDGTSSKGRGGNDTKDAYARLLERLSAFSREFSVENRLFGQSDGMGIDEIIGDDDVTVLESKGLESTFRSFIFGVITAGFYRYAIAQEGGYLAPDQYETVLVIEEANEVLTGSDTAGTGNSQMGLSGQSEFEQMLDQSAGYGLFIIAITQKIADMPKSIIANAGLKFTGKIVTEDDINVVTKAIGKDPRIDDRDVVKWFPRSPTGWFVCQSSRTMNFIDAEPVLVKISMLNVSQPTNAEIDELLEHRDITTKMMPTFSSVTVNA